MILKPWGKPGFDPLALLGTAIVRKLTQMYDSRSGHIMQSFILNALRLVVDKVQRSCGMCWVACMHD